MYAVNVLLTASLLKKCSCGNRCHIRRKQCTACGALFTSKSKQPLSPSKLQQKYPSNIWKRMLVKVQYVYIHIPLTLSWASMWIICTYYGKMNVLVQLDATMTRSVIKYVCTMTFNLFDGKSNQFVDHNKSIAIVINMFYVHTYCDNQYHYKFSRM